MKGRGFINGGSGLAFHRAELRPRNICGMRKLFLTINITTYITTLIEITTTTMTIMMVVASTLGPEHPAD